MVLACMLTASVVFAGDACRTVESPSIMFFDVVDQYGNTSSAVFRDFGELNFLFDASSGNAFIRFTPEQAISIRQFFAEQNLGDEHLFKTLLQTRLGRPDADTQTGERSAKPAPAPKPKKLRPKCNTCLEGHLCNYNNEIACCDIGVQGCTKCTTCLDE